MPTKFPVISRGGRGRESEAGTAELQKVKLQNLDVDPDFDYAKVWECF